MGLSEHIKRLTKNAITSPLFFVFGALIVFSLGMLFGLGYLRYYVDGDSINRRAIHATLLYHLWQEPQFLEGELNLLKGNQEATLSEDGKTMILARSFSRDNSDLFISERGEDGWKKPDALSAFINTGYDERAPHLSRDGRLLLFQSNRPGSRGGYDLFLSQRLGDRWSEPVNLGPNINSFWDDGFACFAHDGSAIYFSSNRPKPEVLAASEAPETLPAGDWDLYRVPLRTPGNAANETLPTYGEPEFLSKINTGWNELHAAMPGSGQLLYFSSDRPEGIGGYDLWMSRWFEGDFIAPENLGKPINSRKDEMHPAFSNRGENLLYVSNVYSIHPQALKYYRAESRQVLSRFDYDLLRNVLLIVLLLVITGLLIHYLLKFLLDSELKLLPRCLIASFLLHLILAALTGSLFLTSKIEETLQHNLSAMTVNLNALARESLSVSIRESVASLPRVEAPSMLEQLVVELPLQVETPINERVNPYPDRVSVQQQSVTSERFTQVRTAPAQIQSAQTFQRVAQLNFANSNLAMESPEGVIQSGDGSEMDPDMVPRPPVEQPVVEQRRVPRELLDAQTYQPVASMESKINDTITPEVQRRSVATAATQRLSGNLSNQIVQGTDLSQVSTPTLEIASSSPTSLTFDRQFGTLMFQPDFTLEVISGEVIDPEDERFARFRAEATGRSGQLGRFGFDGRMTDLRIPSPDGQFGEKLRIERGRVITQRARENQLGGVSDLVKERVPILRMDVDSELEVPEYMLEDSGPAPMRPVF
jgi:hypothetical protein